MEGWCILVFGRQASSIMALAYTALSRLASWRLWLTRTAFFSYIFPFLGYVGLSWDFIMNSLIARLLQ
jgi:hypothetical protein